MAKLTGLSIPRFATVGKGRTFKITGQVERIIERDKNSGRDGAAQTVFWYLTDVDEIKR